MRKKILCAKTYLCKGLLPIDNIAIFSIFFFENCKKDNHHQIDRNHHFLAIKVKEIERGIRTSLQIRKFRCILDRDNIEMIILSDSNIETIWCSGTFNFGMERSQVRAYKQLTWLWDTNLPVNINWLTVNNTFFLFQIELLTLIPGVINITSLVDGCFICTVW